MAQYDVIPFVAKVGVAESESAAAAQLRDLVNKQAQQGWKFIGLQSVETHQAGSSGCFGIGATPGTVNRFDMAVFEK